MLINELPRYEILDEASLQELERGWRRIVSELGIDFLHDEAIEALRGRGPEGRGPARQVRPRLDPRAGGEGARASSTCRRGTQSTRSTSAASTWRSGPCTAVRSCARGIQRREATYADFENLVRLSQAFPQLDTPGGTICEPNDRRSTRATSTWCTRCSRSPTSRSWARSRRGRTPRTRSRWRRWCSAPSRSSETPATLSLINVNSPLRYDDRMLSALLAYAKREPGPRDHAVPAHGCDVAGVGPATLAQQVGEALAGIALVQTIRPGCPVVFGSFLSNTDMQSGSPELRHARVGDRSPAAPGSSRGTTGCRSAAAAG